MTIEAAAALVGFAEAPLLVAEVLAEPAEPEFESLHAMSVPSKAHHAPRSIIVFIVFIVIAPSSLTTKW